MTLTKTEPARLEALSAQELVWARVLIAIPAFEEERDIERVLTRLSAFALGAELLVVDDGSTDSTAAVAARCGATVVVHPFNLGYGAALQTAYKYALNKGYEFVIQMDGDGQHDPCSVGGLLSPLLRNEADVVIGSRFLGDSTYHPPFLRRAGMVLFRKIVFWVIGKEVTDTTSGYQALNRRALGFLARDVYPSDYPDADVLIMLHRNGLRVVETAVKMHHPQGGKSMHSGLIPIYYVFKMGLSIFVTLLRRTSRDSGTLP